MTTNSQTRSRSQFSFMKFISSMGPGFGLLIGIFLSLALTIIAGENPLHVFSILVKSSFGSWDDFALTLYYTTPLIFAGLSVAIAFHAGLFNIGAEGQLTVATLAAAATGALLPNTSPYIAPLVATVAGMCAGAIWGGIAGWLKAYRDSHEVIVTIMLNFIAAGVTSWFTLYVIPNPESQNPETQKVASQFMIRAWDPLAKIAPDSPLSSAVFVAVILAIAMWIFLWKTRWGYELRAVGQNEVAAQYSGISTRKIKFFALTAAGALAGLVALNEVVGAYGQFKMGFSPDYGFIAIAVALLASGNPIAIIFSALLFGALHKGTTSLDLETDTITRDFSKIIQGVIILSVIVAGYFSRRKQWKS